MHLPQLTRDGSLADGLIFAGEPCHVTLGLDHDYAAARDLCDMARLSCESEVTCECPVTCELRWMDLSVDHTKAHGKPVRGRELSRPGTELPSSPPNRAIEHSGRG